MDGSLEDALVARREGDRVRGLVDERQRGGLERDLRAREDDDVVRADRRPVELGDGFPEVARSAVGRVAEVVVLVEREQRLVAARPREPQQLAHGQRLRERVRQVVRQAAVLRHRLVLLRPGLRELHAAVALSRACRL